MENESLNSKLLNSGLARGIELIKKAAKNFPKKPGIYKMISQNKDILYVGKAKNLPKRVISYSRLESMPNRLRRMVAQVDSIEYEVTKTEAEALLLEASLIRNLKPRFNIALRDDKSFPYIFIDSRHKYPRISKFRGAPKNKSDYWGPFASASAVNETIVEIQKIFGIRPCTDTYFQSRKRPCLEYQIDRCAAPCVKKISEEGYATRVLEAKRFLNGKSNTIHEYLQKKMWEYSDAQEYEKAAKMRNRIQILNQIQSKNAFANTTVNFADVIVIVRNNEELCIQLLMIRNSQSFGSKVYFPKNIDEMNDAEILHNFMGQFYQSHTPPAQIITNVMPSESTLLKEAMSNLHKNVKFDIKVPSKNASDKQNILDFVCENAKEALIRKISGSKNIQMKLKGIISLFELQHELKRVEVYDNSHISGKHATGAYIVLLDDGFKRSEYRSFNIKLSQPITGGDDYSMLFETLNRRIKSMNQANYPDLIIIDGGKGHLSCALEVFKSHNIYDIPIVAISKGVNRNAGREFFHVKGRESFQLPMGDENLKFLQMLRNEAHNFAILKYRKKHQKTITKSQLEDIPSIGKKRKLDLLQHFGSFEKIKEANKKDLQRVQGISKAIAEVIYNYLHSGTNHE